MWNVPHSVLFSKLSQFSHSVKPTSIYYSFWGSTLCNPMNRSMPGLPVHHQLSEFTQTHVHRVNVYLILCHLLLLLPPIPKFYYTTSKTTNLIAGDTVDALPTWLSWYHGCETHTCFSFKQNTQSRLQVAGRESHPTTAPHHRMATPQSLSWMAWKGNLLKNRTLVSSPHHSVSLSFF